MPAFDFALSLTMAWAPTDMTYLALFDVISPFTSNIAGTTIVEQVRFVLDMGLITARSLLGQAQGICDIFSAHDAAQFPSDDIT